MNSLYEKLFEMKYKQGVPTLKLAELFSSHRELVSEIALLDIPDATLKKVVRKKELLEKLALLKRNLAAKK